MQIAEIQTKTCHRCGQSKQRGDFNKRARAKDGLQAYCRECDHATSKSQRKSPAGRAYMRAWNKSANGIESRKKLLASEAGASNHRKNARAHRERNPIKAAARRTVRMAIESGLLARPLICSRCEKSPPPRRDGRSKIHAHHADYSKPLAVEWLCPDCHEIADKEIR